MFFTIATAAVSAVTAGVKFGLKKKKQHDKAEAKAKRKKKERKEHEENKIDERKLRRPKR